MDKSWDVFISHASEDKDEVARPLATALIKAGVTVWLDEQELKVGDSLSRKIDEGLARSQFGVVILSPSFFAKHWPRQELAGLRAREEGDRKVILPVWHDVDKADVAGFSPVLADALAATTSGGLERVVALLLDAILSPDGSSPSALNPSVSRRLERLVDSGPDRAALVDFLRSHPRFTRSLFHTSFSPTWNPTIRDTRFDMAVLSDMDPYSPALHLVEFFQLWGDPLAPAARRPGGRKIASDLEAECRAVRGRFADLVGPPDREREEAIWELFFGLKFERAEPMASKVDEKLLMVSPRPPRLGLCILAGRRRFLHDAGAARLWEDFSRRSHPIEIRTYDSLVERLGFVSD